MNSSPAGVLYIDSYKDNPKYEKHFSGKHKKNIKNLLYEESFAPTDLEELMIKQIKIINDVIKNRDMGKALSISICKEDCSQSKKDLEKRVKELSQIKEKAQFEINRLSKELDDMKSNIKHVIHYPSVFFIMGSTGALTLFLFFLLLGVFKSEWIVHPYYCVTGGFGSIGMLLTSLKGLNVWRDRRIGG